MQVGCTSPQLALSARPPLSTLQTWIAVSTFQLYCDIKLRYCSHPPPELTAGAGAGAGTGAGVSATATGAGAITSSTGLGSDLFFTTFVSCTAFDLVWPTWLNVVGENDIAVTKATKAKSLRIVLSPN